MNNMQPFFYPNQMNQMGQISQMGQLNPMENNISMDFRNLEERVYNLEREVNNLKNKLIKIENTEGMKNTDTYTSSYQPNTYNMM